MANSKFAFWNFLGIFLNIFYLWLVEFACMYISHFPSSLEFTFLYILNSLEIYCGIWLEVTVNIFLNG